MVSGHGMRVKPIGAAYAVVECAPRHAARVVHAARVWLFVVHVDDLCPHLLRIALSSASSH